MTYNIIYNNEIIDTTNNIKIPEKYSSEYVCCLPKQLELKIMSKIKKAISSLLLTDFEKQEAIENAYNEKVTNLTDTIKIEWV